MLTIILEFANIRHLFKGETSYSIIERRDIREKLRSIRKVKLPDIPSGRDMGGGASRQGNLILYCAPSRLPAGRDPAYRAGLAGHVPAKLILGGKIK